MEKKKLIQIGIVVLALVLIAGIPYMLSFVPVEIMNEFGALLLIVPVGIIILIFGGAFFILNRKKGNPLVEKREVIVQELKEAERQYLKHTIPKEAFDTVSKEKNAELIRIEAELDSQKKTGLEKKDAQDLTSVSADKKRILKGLLDQKQKKVHELKLSEQSYLKRKIDEATYLKISSDIRRELGTIDAQINALQKAEEVEKIKETLKQGAREIARQKKVTKERALEEEIEDEVIEQLRL